MVIADDEQHIVDGISQCIQWRNLDVSIAGTAYNGLDAYQVVLDEMPDLLLTDIHMPGLSGLELIEKLKTSHPKLKIIIISAYEDFSYAQKAMTLGVTSYIIKPLKKKTIEEEVKKVISIIHNDRSKEEKLNRLNRLYSRSMPMMTEYYLNQFLMGNNEILTKLKELPFMNEFMTQDGWFSIYVIKSLHGNQQPVPPHLWDDLENTFSMHFLNVMFKTYEDERILLFFHKSKEYLTQHSQQLIENFLYSKEDIILQVGVGGLYKDFAYMHKAYLEALSVLNYRDQKRHSSVLSYNNLVPYKDYNRYSRELNPIFHEFKGYLINGDYLKVKETVNSLNTLFEHYQRIHWDIIKHAYCQLISSIIQVMNELKIPFEDVITMRENANLYSFILSISTIDELAAYILGICKSICSLFHNHEEQTENPLINKVIDYIHDHYQEDLSLKDVADYVNLNPSYLSRLFKSQVGVSFVDYVKNIKISYAKRMLRDSNDKIYVICNKVGYSSVQYFTNLFKSKVGVTPKQYRNSV